MFEIKICDTPDEVALQAFAVMAEVLKAPKVTLGLATGSSPVGLYAEMVKAHKAGQLPMSHVTSYNLDEYVGLAPDHPQSYRTFMFEHLFNHVDVPHGNIHLPKGTGDVRQEAAAYAEELANHPRDLQLLGIGSNGHIGFNEPGTPFDSTVHVVDLETQTRQDNARFFTSIDEVPTQAVSMGIKDILAAKKILLIALGDNKAEALHKMVHDPISPDVPCTILQSHPNVIVIADRKAAARLK